MELSRWKPENGPQLTTDALIHNLIDHELPEVAQCPEIVDLGNHKLGRILTRFRRTADEMLATFMKKIKVDPEFVSATPEEREIIKYFWLTEFYQSIYSIDGKWYVNEVRQGGIGSSNIHLEIKNEPTNDKRHVAIHTHPCDSTFSSPDLHAFFLGMDAEKILGYPDPFLYSSLSLQFVVTDHHVYMCFPTKETEVPEFADSLASGLIGAEFLEDLMATEFEKAWMELLLKYGVDRLEPFLGNILFTGNHKFFPEEVSDLGANLINLAHTLGLCQKYSLPLYVAEKGNMKFRRIRSVEDVYNI